MAIKKRTVTLNGTKFILGNKYSDTLMKTEGTATAGITYLTGCDQLCIEWNDDTGRPVAQWVDVTRIEKADPPKKIKVKPRAGGPAPAGLSRAPTTDARSRGARHCDL